MSLNRRFPFIWCASWLVLATTVSAQAALIPNGTPRHDGTADATLGTATSTAGQKVILDPNPAVFMPEGSCPWLLPALQAKAQPYNTNPNEVWEYAYASLKADLTLNSYEAWADNSPTLKLGSNTFAGSKAEGWGGAGIVLTYSPTADQIKAGAPDPSKNTIYWVQVIHSNRPSPRGETYGVPYGSATVYMDNASKADGSGIDPYYGHLTGFAAANGNGFVDRTSFDLESSVGLHWQAQVFLATEKAVLNGDTGVTTKTVTIYDGVWWGFRIVPEPGTWVLLVLGSGWFLIALRRRVQRA